MGVPFEATLVQVRERFRKLAMDYHPDRILNLPPQQRKHSEEMFKLIQEELLLAIEVSEDLSNFIYELDYKSSLLPKPAEQVL